jgi:hypothetical protein
MDGSNGIFADLLTVEVNTIVKDSMTAHKMPSLPFALLDILEHYARALVRFGVELGPYLAPSSDDLWLALTQRDEVVAQAEDGYLAVHGTPAEAPEERRDLYNYVNDLWPVLERAGERYESAAGRRFSMIQVSNGWDSFERLRIAAHELLDRGGLSKPDEVMVRRITGSCARLKFIVQSLQRREPARRNPRRGRDLASWDELIPKTRNELLHGSLRDKAVPLHTLAPEHRATVRKIWEVGTERILMQTCVQVDGDVVTRIAEDLLEHHAEAVRDLVMRAHRESIDTSLGHWRALVEVALKLFADLLRRRPS